MIVRPAGARGLQRLDHRGGVGGVGHQEDLVVGDVVGDQVVDDATGFGAAQRVLRLARPDAAQVVGERGVDELRGARSADQRLTEVADVEQADRVAGGGVLTDRARIRHRHQPAAELGETGAQLTMAVFQGSVHAAPAHADTDPSRRLDGWQTRVVVDRWTSTRWKPRESPTRANGRT